jgi:hypothetical protein
VSRLLFLFALTAPLFLATQGCLMGGADDKPAETVRTDTLYVDTLHLRDTTWIMDTSNTIAGVWLLHRLEAEWTEGGVTEYDTVVIDTANPYAREFYVFRSGSVLWSWYNPSSNNSDVQTVRQLTDTLWLVGERDTVSIVRNANALSFTFAATFTGGSFRTELFFTAYSRPFPPLEWSGVTEALPNSTPETAITVVVDSSPQSHFLPPDGAAWFRFDAVADTEYLIRTFGQTDTYLELFDAAGTVLLAENDDYDAPGAGWNAGIEWTAPAAGSHLFRVTGYDMFEAGSYTISVTEITGGGLDKPAAVSSPESPRKRPVHLLRALNPESGVHQMRMP